MHSRLLRRELRDRRLRFKRGRIYWYKFMWNGEMVRESTRQTNQNAARQMEAAHRASLAKGEVAFENRSRFPPSRASVQIA
jgi:hypothetical protein